jgi:predicted cobalt transporter CbtA
VHSYGSLFAVTSDYLYVISNTSGCFLDGFHLLVFSLLFEVVGTHQNFATGVLLALAGFIVCFGAPEYGRVIFRVGYGAY